MIGDVKAAISFLFQHYLEWTLKRSTMAPSWLLLGPVILLGHLCCLVHCNQSRIHLGKLNYTSQRSPAEGHSPTTVVITKFRRKNETWSKGHLDMATIHKGRFKRAIRRNKACEMLIAIDEPLYR